MRLLGLTGLIAAVAFAATFRGPRERFWDRMTATSIVLGGLAVAAEPRNRRPRLGPFDLIAGVASAGVLYVIFQVGDRIARLVLPAGGREIQEIYALRGTRPAVELAARLALLIGPAEEIFWRGFVQRRLMERLGRWRGTAVATAAYAGVHVSSGNLTLVGAAGTAGAFWAFLYAVGLPLAALVVSHVAWDIWIFLVAPTSPRDAPGAVEPIS